MSIWSVRPNMKQMVFAVFARPLHPELFDIRQSFEMRRAQHEFTIWITEFGHVVTWQHDDLIVSEVLTAYGAPLPKTRRLFSYRTTGHTTEEIRCADVVLQLGVSVEQLKPELFQRVAEELEEDSRREGRLSYRFPSTDRMQPSALSYVVPEATASRLIVYTFHTFPEECGVLKTQSVYEVLDD